MSGGSPDRVSKWKRQRSVGPTLPNHHMSYISVHVTLDTERLIDAYHQLHAFISPLNPLRIAHQGAKKHYPDLHQLRSLSGDKLNTPTISGSEIIYYYYNYDGDEERRRLGGEAEEGSFGRGDSGYGSGERGVHGGDRVAALGGAQGPEMERRRRCLRSQPDSEDQS
nr:uncharacterized protein LOC109180220 [Ipomoea trifida]